MPNPPIEIAARDAQKIGRVGNNELQFIVISFFNTSLRRKTPYVTIHSDAVDPNETAKVIDTFQSNSGYLEEMIATVMRPQPYL